VTGFRGFREFRFLGRPHGDGDVGGVCVLDQRCCVAECIGCTSRPKSRNPPKFTESRVCQSGNRMPASLHPIFCDAPTDTTLLVDNWQPLPAAKQRETDTLSCCSHRLFTF